MSIPRSGLTWRRACGRARGRVSRFSWRVLTRATCPSRPAPRPLPPLPFSRAPPRVWRCRSASRVPCAFSRIFPAPPSGPARPPAALKGCTFSFFHSGGGRASAGLRLGSSLGEGFPAHRDLTEWLAHSTLSLSQADFAAGVVRRLAVLHGRRARHLRLGTFAACRLVLSSHFSVRVGEAS